MKRCLTIFAAVILLAFVAAPVQALNDIVATIAAGKVQVIGSQAGKNKPIYWEGTQVTNSNKFGLFQFSTADLPIDCVGQLSNGISTIPVVIFGCTTQQVVGGGVPKTGQTICYDSSGNVITCTGTGQDGDLQKGLAWPNPRFTDNNNGTITDNLTKLIWLKNATCTDTVGGIDRSLEQITWADALTWSNNLANGNCSLTDGSIAGQWRLPNVRELQSLVDYSQLNPSLPSNHPFLNFLSIPYWSSTTFITFANLKNVAWTVNFHFGIVGVDEKIVPNYVTAVRGGS